MTAPCFIGPYYSCMGCDQIFCMECHASKPDLPREIEVKTAVRWCDDCVELEAFTNGVSADRMAGIRARRKVGHR